MRLRQLPGLALLGLLSALLAHAGSYGGSHEAGGVYHTVLLLTATAGAGGLVLVAALLAIAGSRRHGDGSIFASLLRPALPGRPALLATASLWFAGIEAAEPRHAEVSLLVIAAALLIATAVTSALARGFVDALAQIVFHVTSGSHRKRERFVHRWFAPPPSARAVAFAYRRFARPPPV